ncbi:MAG: glutamate synthase large subunit [Bacteroidales bacterium]|nr:glutamate synthase large subunit [Bacteroidales bacterium]
MQVGRVNTQGLYSPDYEHDNCGVGFVADIKGIVSHDIVKKGLEVLENLTHRGAESADNETGDGAGILIQIPRDFYLLHGIKLPNEGRYATGIIFLPKDKKEADICSKRIIEICKQEKIQLIAVRDVPVNSKVIGEISRKAEPAIIQYFFSSEFSQEQFERKLYVARKRIEKEIRESNLIHKDSFYINSLSTKTLVYKGMFTAEQLGKYYLDLQDENLKSAVALVHSRFSTNTFPTWDLAHPFRILCHNGEINTVKGNRYWMQAREALLKSDLFGNDLEKIFPIIEPGKSDSASLDNVLEFLVLAGKSLPHAMSILIPESWNDKNPIPNDLKAYFEYYSTIMEPWDGPASVLVCDGRYIGGLLDRNGLRPSRYLITKDDLFIMGSETGVQDITPENIREKGRLRPGKILLIDTKEGRVLYDPEIKEQLAKKSPYTKWLKENRLNLEGIDLGRAIPVSLGNEYHTYLQTFGYTKEDVEMIIADMAEHGKEPTGSMGNDAPLAILSNKPQRLFTYFRQLFAQVTNPAIDPIREELVMTLTGYIGSHQKNVLDDIPDHAKMIKFKSPVISNKYLEILKNLKYKGFTTTVIPVLFNTAEGGKGLEKAIDEICKQAEEAVDTGKNYIIITDKGISKDKAPIPVLLAVSAIHHYLLNKKKRMQIDIVVETAEPREVMHFALLFGYGASIINPYLCFAVIDELIKDNKIKMDIDTASNNFINAINKGILKIMSKMGISTLRSYRAAQNFESVGLNKDFIARYFEGTDSRIGGIGINEIAEEVLIPHKEAFASSKGFMLPSSGFYQYRYFGEKHAWNPESVSLLQWATKTGDYKKFKEFTAKADEYTNEPNYLRGFFNFKSNPIDISEVEPVENILKRFVTGAMSFGSISKEAHETLALAMNRIGGKSNTGEGGEDPERYKPLPDGSSKRSKIKQVASGRFGVTTHYLVNADELQIKIAQGAKPGEGGQLPGYKIDEIIAKTRHSIPGITLISPPPHHDIYSIEDLAQLIFDLKNVNPNAKVSVKLVSECGVGTVAAGVAKANADIITISGCEGGTGASPASSIKHAGLPMELGLAETQQTLVLNNLRSKVRLQTDGQLKTGRDIISAALLGAEEYGFATGALVVLGCVLMRKCHLNTCPVGIATQDPVLRARFYAKADFVVNFFTFLAQEVREYLAELGFKKLDDIIGRTDLIEQRNFNNRWKISNINLDALLHRPKEAGNTSNYCCVEQLNKTANVLDHELIKLSSTALASKIKVIIEKPIFNTDRSTGAMLSGEIAKRYGEEGLPVDTITAVFKGSAGQSFGAFLTQGITFKLEGDANDYLGKGLSGGKIVVVPPDKSTFLPEKNIIVGNTLLYGATRGEVFIRGIAGERFAVRNSGAIAVIEGTGDHCCEYMTGGRVVVLGKTGRNFAAGMSGGLAYVFDEDKNFDYFCNMGMVELSLVEEISNMKELKELINKHFLYTGSTVARTILESWDEYLPKFIQVTPFEYRKIMKLEKLKDLDKKISQIIPDY